ncbi:MAG: F0F1 ATP synthase subunit A [Bacteroidales bacterium]|nr:F0F1 ATP synthase subunit A [Bacteroidales bacterium]
MKRTVYIILSAILTFCNLTALADNNKDAFNAGDVIMEHLGDEHSWHILTWKDKEVAIPLPVILINDGKLTCFMSSQFHHGHNSYKGFKIGSNNDGKDLGGKIICVDSNDNYTGKKPLDFSITKNVLGIFIIAIIICCIVLSSAKQSKRREGKEPKGMQTVTEYLVEFISKDIAIPSIGEGAYLKYMNYLLSVFTFIFLCNIMGLLPFFPGGANITGNIAVTLTLALFTFIITQFSTTKTFWKHTVNPDVPAWLKIPVPLMPVLEFIEIFTKPFSLTVRLFANITAGHVIMLSLVCIIFIFGHQSIVLGYSTSIIPLIFSVFMMLIEMLVAFIQAYVFTLLSAIYIGMARVRH